MGRRRTVSAWRRHLCQARREHGWGRPNPIVRLVEVRTTIGERARLEVGSLAISDHARWIRIRPPVEWSPSVRTAALAHPHGKRSQVREREKPGVVGAQHLEHVVARRYVHPAVPRTRAESTAVNDENAGLVALDVGKAEVMPEPHPAGSPTDRSDLNVDQQYDIRIVHTSSLTRADGAVACAGEHSVRGGTTTLSRPRVHS